VSVAPSLDPLPIAGSVPLELLRGILDDAATFPPGNAAMRDSVEARAMYEDSWFAPLVGSVVLRADRTNELLDVLAGCGQASRQVSGPLPVTVTVPGGPAAIGDAVRAVQHRALRPVAFEVPLGQVEADTALLVRIRMEVPPQAQLHVELSSTVDPADAMPVLAEAGVRGKIRTGGTTASAFPDVATVARFVHSAVRAGVPFKATAGLHNALRHRDEDTGFEHHGFVNLLAATTAALLHDADEQQVGVLLATREHDPLLEVLTALDADRATAVRHAFVSFGTCSTVEPVEDLAGLGMVVRPGVGA
jgi:hypothetical protein